MSPYDLYKGATRAPESLGIPRNACLYIFTVSAALAMMFYKPLFLISIPIYWKCLNLYREDKDNFSIVGLWIKTTWIHKFLCGDDAEYLCDDYTEKENWK
ncbi:VirB3 family type IV secretion system protein [Enterobacter hormaechei]|jgi:type IV secretory pathway VirB3-like protein|uniref:Type IV secretion system protein VirB3 n=1 Tax=Enterobacter quasimori TaxID=2838947 RepID=A0ABY0ANB6_9ENTR|nr:MULTISPECIES: VirB3 family type IV secretion system protein [Enterobacter]ELQ6006560.1 VirB3 family type IV secretion system protein [Cronobacter sakazakii]MBT1854701.1 VirB3 family type IV secretion system protein [Enterobacter hormaechei subsp. hoffmannii]RTN18993.1 hypothetical protein EKN94_20685 [Enterobacter quasimori]HAY4304024.1 hypothetical protein [Escherichia coli]HBX8197163.1 hypothetical protein [Klebsiella pneumoniae]HEP0317251.1 VirB3 family type IV secretion system protein 